MPSFKLVCVASLSLLLSVHNAAAVQPNSEGESSRLAGANGEQAENQSEEVQATASQTPRSEAEGSGVSAAVDQQSASEAQQTDARERQDSQEAAVGTSVAGRVSSGTKTRPLSPWVYWLYVLFLPVYLCVICIARAMWVLAPNRKYLSCAIAGLKARLVVDQPGPDIETKTEKSTIDPIMNLLEKAEPTRGFADYFATGTLTSSWRLYHEGDVLAVNVYTDSVVKAKAVVVSKRLAALKSATMDPRARVKTDQIAKQLEELKGKPGELREAVKEGLRVLYEARDGFYETLWDWFNKAVWLIFTAGALVLVLSVTLNQLTLLLLGAIGGLLSKLRKVVVRKRTVPFDYGVSWTTLFLTPLVGALTGWSGVLLVTIFTETNLLGSSFGGITWMNAETEPKALGLALLFGFSATLFERFVERAEEEFQTTPGAKENGDVEEDGKNP